MESKSTKRLCGAAAAELDENRKKTLIIEKNIRDYAFKLLKDLALTTDNFINTYINVLPSDILFNSLYPLINFDMAFHGQRILCPHCMSYDYAHYNSCIGEEYRCGEKRVWFYYQQCRHCDSLFICLNKSEFTTIVPCLYIHKVSAPNLNYQKIINSYCIKVNGFDFFQRGIVFDVIYNGYVSTVKYQN
jgi:hypothetical protein